MSLFGLDAALVRRLIDAVAPAAPASETREGTAAPDAPAERLPAAERFARGAFGLIAEPGDGDAGMLVAALGAPRALALLVRREPAERILAEVAGHEAEAAERLRSRLTAALDRWRPRIDSGRALAAFDHAARVGARLIVPGDAAWPVAVDDLGRHAPLGLWVRGDERAVGRTARSISLVGARASTGYGDHVAAEAAAGLSDRGFAIVSGAAYGIDGVAHRAALASDGLTVAFLAGGVDRFYPSGHHELLGRIAETGAVLSELPCGAAPTRWRFLQRNRLIAAVGRATIVLEAGRRSGSLNTAGHAAALGRPLGAVPGPVTSPASAGCHRLIREYGAQLVTTPAEMAELAGEADDALLPGSGPSAADDEAPEETRLLDALSTRTPRTVADLAARSGLSTTQVAATLGVLRLDGRAADRPGGWLRSRTARRVPS